MKSKTQRGFTLIEVMVTVVIVAILAAIVYPSYQESVRKAKRAEGRSALLRDMQQQERDYSRMNSYIAFTSSSPGNYRGFSGDNAGNSAYTVSAAACGGHTIQACVEITAKPTFTDDRCGSLTLTSMGVQGATGSKPKECW